MIPGETGGSPGMNIISPNSDAEEQVINCIIN
jgi:hypothetical protein